MTEELIPADIQMPFLEYRANYKEPIISIWFDRRQGDVIDALLNALAPHLLFENIGWNQTAKNLAETHLSFSLPSIFSTILVGVRGITINVLNPDWSRAPLFISVFQNAVDALKTSTGKDLEGQQLTLGFHLKPGVKPFRETVTRFVNPKALKSEDAGSFGVSVYYPDRSFVIDSSAAVPGGIFIKLIRSYNGGKRLEEMATVLRKDEETTLQYLGLKLE